MSRFTEQLTDQLTDREPSFGEAYAELSRIASLLERGDADLDEILPLLEQAKAAYERCQARIEAVKQVLGQEWLQTQTQEGQE